MEPLMAMGIDDTIYPNA